MTDELTLQMKDGNGEEHSYRILTVFTIENREQQYIALLPTEPNEKEKYEIELYRCQKEGEGIRIDIIPSDMELEEARQEFEKLLDKEIEENEEQKN